MSTTETIAWIALSLGIVSFIISIAVIIVYYNNKDKMGKLKKDGDEETGDEETGDVELTAMDNKKSEDTVTLIKEKRLKLNY